MNKFSLEAKVGLLFLACLAIAAYVWIKVFEVSFQEGFLLKAHFRSVEGLVPGAQVQIAGIKVGSVKNVLFDSESSQAQVLMEIKDAYRNVIPDDSRVYIRTKGLLGDKFLVIEPGRPNARKLKPGETIKMVVEPTDTEKVFESIGVVAQDLQVLTREARRQLIDEKGSQKIDRIITNADASFSDVKEILANNKEKINKTVDNTDSLTKGLNEIITRNKEKINKTVDNTDSATKGLNEIVARNRDRINKTVDDLERVTKDVREGRGTLGKLVNDEALYRDTHGLVRDIRGISSSIQSGRGAVGRLINDPELYFEARRAIRNMNKTAEDVSEATPISTLAIILGSVFR
jgi:phospholipid/cholesterol/gamma-HCH transport system substrate-binding protein